MTGITVDQLAQMCLKMSAQGKGNKMVLMSSDDECNEYHQAWSGLVDGSEVAPYIESYQIRSSLINDLSQVVILT